MCAVRTVSESHPKNFILKCYLVSFHLFFPFLLVLAVVSMLRLRSPMMPAASVMTKLGKLNYPDRNFVGKLATLSSLNHLASIVDHTETLLQ